MKNRMNMIQSEIVPADIRVLSEQIYQYKKGVRRMVLYTPDFSAKNIYIFNYLIMKWL